MKRGQEYSGSRKQCRVCIFYCLQLCVDEFSATACVSCELLNAFGPNKLTGTVPWTKKEKGAGGREEPNVCKPCEG
jgi:hypothetical protein